MRRAALAGAGECQSLGHVASVAKKQREMDIAISLLSPSLFSAGPQFLDRATPYL